MIVIILSGIDEKEKDKTIIHRFIVSKEIIKALLCEAAAKISHKVPLYGDIGILLVRDTTQ